MFDIGFLELVLVGIVALLVLGPERLPHAARMTGAFLGRMSRMVQSVRDEVEREVNVYEMQQRIKKQVEEGMIGDLRKELSEAQKAIQEGFNATANPPVSGEIAPPAELPAPVNAAPATLPQTTVAPAASTATAASVAAPATPSPKEPS